MADQLEQAREAVSASLAELSKLFQSHCKLTFVMRNPEYPDGTMLITDDDPQKVVEAITELMKDPGHDSADSVG